MKYVGQLLKGPITLWSIQPTFRVGPGLSGPPYNTSISRLTTKQDIFSAQSIVEASLSTGMELWSESGSNVSKSAQLCSAAGSLMDDDVTRYRREMAAAAAAQLPWPLSGTEVDRISWNIRTHHTGQREFVTTIYVYDDLLINSLIMVALCNMANHYIFALWFLSSFFFSRLISAAVGWMSTIL